MSYETGKTDPSRPNLLAWAMCTGVPVSWLRPWHDLVAAGFPPVDVPDEIRQHLADSDPGERDEHEAAAGEQMPLFPDERFGRLSTLAELAKYADEQRQYTDNMAARDEKRAAYLQRLIAAVGGDLSATWEHAEAALAA